MGVGGGGYDKLPGGWDDGAPAVDELPLSPVLRGVLWFGVVCVIDMFHPPVHPEIIGGRFIYALSHVPPPLSSRHPVRDGRQRAVRFTRRSSASLLFHPLIVVGYRCAFFVWALRTVFSLFFKYNTHMQQAHQTGLTLWRVAMLPHRASCRCFLSFSTSTRRIYCEIITESHE